MRLFVAIELDEKVRSALAELQGSLKRACDGVRWIPAHQLHLTARFLGDVPDAEAGGVGEAIARAGGASKPFAFELSGCGCFPTRGGVRIVWVGINEPSGALADCVEAVNRELELLDFERERRPFSAHITIGRVREDRSGRRIRSGVEAMDFGPFEQQVKTLTLMQSVLSPQGPTYTPVTAAALGGT